MLDNVMASVKYSLEGNLYKSLNNFVGVLVVLFLNLVICEK